MPRNPPPDKPAARDKPIAHFTKQGERYVDAGELLGSDAAKEGIESMMQIDSEDDLSKHASEDRPERILF